MVALVPSNGALEILVVDDEPTIRAVLSIALQMEGYQVVTACNGQEALHRLGAHLPDAILLDLQMPVMNGWQVIDACHAVPATSRIPIITISAAFRIATPAELGVASCLSKPFDLDALLIVLEDVLRQEPSAV